MSVNRLILLVVVLGGLIVFIAQNLSVLPPLPLVFLGIHTQPLPLSVWILVSTVAGAIVYEVISSLLLLPNFRERQETFKSSTTPKTKTSTRSNSQRYSSAQTESRSERSSSPPPKSATKSETQEYDDDDDWDNAGNVNDWDFEDEREETASGSYRETEVRDTNTPPNNREQKSTYDPDSTYSYNFREQQNSGVGKTESIYDADYRVIASPYQPSSTNQPQSSNTNQFDEEEGEDDEWDFLEDDDFEVKDKRPRE